MNETAEMRQLIRDAMRYRRLRVLGAAPGGSIHEEQGTVLRFTNLDEAMDADLERERTRGEELIQDPARDPDSVIDRKFMILAVNLVNGKVYDETSALLLCAKDAAVPPALLTYRDACARLGSNQEHIDSIAKLSARVQVFQTNRGGGRVPDTIGEELPRCLEGKGV